MSAELEQLRAAVLAERKAASRHMRDNCLETYIEWDDAKEATDDAFAEAAR